MKSLPDIWSPLPDMTDHDGIVAFGEFTDFLGLLNLREPRSTSQCGCISCRYDRVVE